MGETTSQPTDHPAHQPTDHPAKKKKKSHVSTWIALTSAAIAISAAVISGFQLNIASRQNTVGEQAQLVTLTTTIAQQIASEPATISQTGGAAHGTAQASAYKNTIGTILAELAVEGQAGALLINELNGAGVAGIEYIEVAQAVGSGGDIPHAIILYKDALNTPPRDPVTIATALRYLGSLYYAIAQPVTGHQYLMRAAKVFNGHPELNASYIRNTTAQAYLMDADSQLVIKGCNIAAADMKAAQLALSSFSQTLLIQADINLYNNEKKVFCSGGG